MNSASQNFPHHLGALRQRMLHPTDYELAVNYFLEEFAGDMAFVRGSEPEQMPQLVAVLNIVVSKATRRQVEVENALVSLVRAKLMADAMTTYPRRTLNPSRLQPVLCLLFVAAAAPPLLGLIGCSRAVSQDGTCSPVLLLSENFDGVTPPVLSPG